MSLFKKSQPKKPEEAPEASVPAELEEPVSAAGGPLVLNIEGMASSPEPAAPKLTIEEADEDPKRPLQNDAEGGSPAPEEAVPAAPDAGGEQPLTVLLESENAGQPAAPAETAPETPAAPAAAQEELPTPASEEGQTPAAPPAAPSEPDGPETDKPLAAVTYEEVAEAIAARRDQGKEPTLTRSAIDDETLLAEIYALIGGPDRSSPAPEAGKKEAPLSSKGSVPSDEPVSEEPKPAEAPPTPEAVQTPAEEPQQPVHISAGEPDAFAERSEEDAGGTPGWVKGLFLLLISMLLSGMTLYAVATDLIGKLFD